MKALFTLLTTLLSINIYSQNYVFNDLDFEYRKCEFNSDSLWQLKNWDIYQTIDGQLNGPIDSSQCIEAYQIIALPYSLLHLNLEGFDKTRPLIFRTRIDSIESYPIKANYSYQVQGYIMDELFSSNDPGLVRNEVQITTTIPNADGSQLIDRSDIVYTGANGNYKYINSCITSQKFETGQYVKEIKILANLSLFEDSYFNNEVYFPIHIELYSFSELNSIESVEVEPEHYFADSNYYYYDLSAQANDLITLLGHTQDGYPSVNNIDYIDVNLIENTTEPQKIVIADGSPYHTLLFQDYARFRAGLTADSDSLRHKLELHIDSTLMCMGLIIDLVLDPTVDLYLSGDGGLDFNTYRSCVTTLGSSTIHIDNGYSLFGDNGNGMIALLQDGAIHIHNGSELEIGARILHNKDNPDHTPSITIEKGAKLYFNEFADILNDLAEDLLIDVYLHEGGIIDYDNLSYEDQQKLNIIEVKDEPLSTSRETTIYPNPSINKTQITSYAPIQSIIILDQMGRRVLELQDINHRDYTLNTSDLSTGLYYIHIETEQETIVRKMIKI